MLVLVFLSKFIVLETVQLHTVSILCYSLWFRFWRGLYNQFDRGLQPRQSALEGLVAMKEETRQLEDSLAICEQVRDHGLTDCF